MPLLLLDQWLKSLPRYIVFYLSVILLVGFSIATQYVAHVLQHTPYVDLLGKPLIQFVYPWNWLSLIVSLLIVLSAYWVYVNKGNVKLALMLASIGTLLVYPICTPIYNPIAFWDWYDVLKDEVVTQSIWPVVFYVLLVTGILCAILLFTLQVQLSNKQKANTSDTHGSAHWATIAEVEKSKLKGDYDPFGVYVGAWQHPKTKKIHYLRSVGAEHVFAYAPTRSGKGVGLVIPTLLSYAGSVLVNDLKLENWQLTAGWRKHMGSLVFKFDPTCSDNSTARYNPLLEVRQGVNEVRDVQNIADMLVNPDGKSKNDHWSSSANSLLVSTILHVLYAERDKSLTGVRNFLANPNRSETETLQQMLNTIHDPDDQFGWYDNSTGHRVSTHPLVASGAREMLNKSEAERTSIISTALTFLKLYRDPVIAKNTSVSDFTIQDLVSNKKPASLYLGVPPSDVPRTMPLMRLILNQILSRLTESMDFTQGTNGTADKHPLLLMLDEFPQFGKLAFFEKALAYIAGYGIRAYLISQDLTQLYAEYGHQQSIIANCHVRTAYAPNTYETAQHLSQLLGDKTVVLQQKNYSGRRLEVFLKNVSTHEHEVRRSLLNPDELMRMPENKAIIFKTGVAPIDGQKIVYYQDPVFSERSKISAPHASDRLELQHPWYQVIDTPILNKNTNVVTAAEPEKNTTTTIHETNDPNINDDVFGEDLLPEIDNLDDGKAMI